MSDISIIPDDQQSHCLNEKADLRKAWKIAVPKKQAQYIAADDLAASIAELQGERNSSSHTYGGESPPGTTAPGRRSSAQNSPRTTRSSPTPRSQRSIRGIISSSAPPGLYYRSSPVYRDMQINNPDLARVIEPQHIRRTLTTSELITAYPGVTAGYYRFGLVFNASAQSRVIAGFKDKGMYPQILSGCPGQTAFTGYLNRLNFL